MTDPGSSSPSFEEQMRALERITKLFRPERMVYLCFAIAAFVMLIACLVVALVRQEQSAVSTIGAFGSSGVVAFTSSRVLLMWNKAMSIITAKVDSDG